MYITQSSCVLSVNISNAAVFGLRTDLHLAGNQFNTALVVL